MKRLLLSRSCKLYQVDIDIYLIKSQYVAAEFDPIYREDGTIDPHAWKDYQEFLINLYGVFLQNGYEIMKDSEKQSPRSESYYFRVYNSAKSSESNIRKMIFVRVSTHFLDEEGENRQLQYMEDEAERLKKPKFKKHQVWSFKNIVINDDTYDNYDEALDSLSKNIRSWR